MRYLQPQAGPILLERSSPLAAKVVNLYTAGRDAVTGRLLAASDGAAQIVTSRGLAIPISGSNYVDLGTTFGATGSFTFVVQFCSTGVGTSLGDVLAYGDRATVRIVPSSGNVDFYTYNGSSWDEVNALAAVAQNIPATVVCVHDAVGGSNTVYVQQSGILTVATVAASPRSSGAHNLRIGLDDETSRSMVGWVTTAQAIGRGVSAAEALSLLANPWQLLKAGRRPYGTAVAVTNAFSSTVAATVAGSGASISAATVNSLGTATPTGAGASIAAAAGSISAVASVTGIGAARVAGVVSESASVVINGTGAAVAAATVSELGVSSATGLGASTASGVISELGSAAVLGVSGSGGASPAVGSIAATSSLQGVGGSIVSAAGSISASAGANAAGAIVVSAAGQISVAATVRGSSSRAPARRFDGPGRPRHRITHQAEEAELFDLAALLVPLISKGGPLWVR